MTWKITITKAANGYILSSEEAEGGVTEVLEEKSTEKETMTDLLYKVAEFFGMNHDKFAKDNLNITFDKKGDKVYID